MKLFVSALALATAFAIGTGGSTNPHGEVLDFTGTGGSTNPHGEVLDFA